VICETCEALKVEIDRLETIQSATQTLLELRRASIGQDERRRLATVMAQARYDRELLQVKLEAHKRTHAD
jgi:hypothetical protein